MTGIIEIMQVIPPATTDDQQSTAPVIQPMFVTCSLDGSIILYEIKPLDGQSADEHHMLNESSNEEPQRQNQGILRDAEQPSQSALQRMFSCFKPRNKSRQENLDQSEMRPSLAGYSSDRRR